MNGITHLQKCPVENWPLPEELSNANTLNKQGCQDFGRLFLTRETIQSLVERCCRVMMGKIAGDGPYAPSTTCRPADDHCHLRGDYRSLCPCHTAVSQRVQPKSLYLVLVGFPFFLTALFFLTLNFNYKSFYSPSPNRTANDNTPTLNAQPNLQCPVMPAKRYRASPSRSCFPAPMPIA